MKRKKKHRNRTEPKQSRTLRDLERSLKPRQMFALRHPVPIGAKTLPRDERFERSQVIGNAEWRVRTLFDMGGAPEMLGPCWRVQVELRRADDLSATPLLVSEWTGADQMQSKAIALAELRHVGFGANVSVFVTDTALEVWKLSKVLEAACAESMLQRDAAVSAAAPEADHG